MSFIQIWVQALLVIMIMMTILWTVSVFIKNVSIVDLFWGLGFVLTAAFYFIYADGLPFRKNIVMTLTAIWGLRLAVYLAWRNLGKGEDFRYREFRRKYGENRYWLISFFLSFLLQGIVMWLISAPLLGALDSGADRPAGILDYIGIIMWLTGFVFEAGSDYQLARFKADRANKGKLLDKGFWRYTRHPNYFGDSMVWWGFGLICISAGSYLPALGSLLMTALIIKVSGVALLEKSLKEQKPEYIEYMRKTSSFFPWFPRKWNKKIQ